MTERADVLRSRRVCQGKLVFNWSSYEVGVRWSACQGGPRWVRDSDFTTYCKYDKSQSIKSFGNNTIEGVSEGKIVANIEYGGKLTQICLMQVMHVPKVEEQILSLKVLDQRGFESCIARGCICIMR